MESNLTHLLSHGTTLNLFPFEETVKRLQGCVAKDSYATYCEVTTHHRTHLHWYNEHKPDRLYFLVAAETNNASGVQKAVLFTCSQDQLPVDGTNFDNPDVTQYIIDANVEDMVQHSILLGTMEYNKVGQIIASDLTQAHNVYQPEEEDEMNETLFNMFSNETILNLYPFQVMLERLQGHMGHPQAEGNVHTILTQYNQEHPDQLYFLLAGEVEKNPMVMSQYPALALFAVGYQQVGVEPKGPAFTQYQLSDFNLAEVTESAMLLGVLRYDSEGRIKSADMDLGRAVLSANQPHHRQPSWAQPQTTEDPFSGDEVGHHSLGLFGTPEALNRLAREEGARQLLQMQLDRYQHERPKLLQALLALAEHEGDLAFSLLCTRQLHAHTVLSGQRTQVVKVYAIGLSEPDAQAGKLGNMTKACYIPHQKERDNFSLGFSLQGDSETRMKEYASPLIQEAAVDLVQFLLAGIYPEKAEVVPALKR